MSIEKLVKAIRQLKENVVTMEEQCSRFNRLGQSHAELDLSIEDTKTTIRELQF